MSKESLEAPDDILTLRAGSPSTFKPFAASPRICCILLAQCHHTQRVCLGMEASGIQLCRISLPLHENVECSGRYIRPGQMTHGGLAAYLFIAVGSFDALRKHLQQPVVDVLLMLPHQPLYRIRSSPCEPEDNRAAARLQPVLLH